MKFSIRPKGILLILMMFCGCGTEQSAVNSDSSAGARSANAIAFDARQGTTAEAELGDSSQPNSVSDSDAGLLDQATDLIRRATDSSTSGAETTQKWIAEKIGDATDSGSDIAGDASDWVNKMYKSLKDQGLTSAGNARQWLADDIGNMSAFQYKVVKISLADVKAMEGQLNELGKLRWECFHAVQQGDETILFFKKGRRSFLQNVPVRDLLKLVPLMGNGEAE